jgi:lipopolysaccharide/colanic/teichoic acid biosynthesis glycosyltransferase
MTRSQSVIKRAFDIAFAAASLIVLSPLFLMIAIAIKLDSAGSVLFFATRLGQDANPFSIVKFRTMTAARRTDQPITLADDRRVTRVGALLRKTKLDEMPQLVNVFRGEMSVVGPRPEDPRYREVYLARAERIYGFRPGITSPAAIQFHNEAALMADAGNWEEVYVQQILPQKLALDLDYVDNYSLLRDASILAATAVFLARQIAMSFRPAPSSTAMTPGNPR